MTADPITLEHVREAWGMVFQIDPSLTPDAALEAGFIARDMEVADLAARLAEAERTLDLRDSEIERLEDQHAMDSAGIDSITRQWQEARAQLATAEGREAELRAALEARFTRPRRPADGCGCDMCEELRAIRRILDASPPSTTATVLAAATNLVRVQIGELPPKGEGTWPVTVVEYRDLKDAVRVWRAGKGGEGE